MTGTRLGEFEFECGTGLWPVRKASEIAVGERVLFCGKFRRVTSVGRHRGGLVSLELDDDLEFWKADDKIDVLIVPECLSTVAALQAGWDGRWAPAPNGWAIANATLVIGRLSRGDMSRYDVDADVTGGVAITVFAQDSARNAWFVCPNRDRPHVILHGAFNDASRWIESTEDMTEIKDFLAGGVR